MTLLSEQPQAENLTPEQQLEQDIALVLQTALDHHHKGEFDDAEALYRIILESLPNHADVQYNLGVLLTQTARAADGVAFFQQCIGIKPNNGQYWVGYINALIEADQTAAAWLAVELAQKFGVKGKAVDGLIVRLANPGKIVTMTPVAVDTPTPETGTAASDASDSPAPQAATPTAAKTSIAAGRRVSQQETTRFTSLYNRGQIAEAVKLARSLTQRFPLDGNTWRWLGISLHRLGRYDDALAPLQKAAELLPEELECRAVLGDTFRLKGMFKDATAACREALAINPDYAEAQRILGMTLVHQGQVAEGLAAARRAIELAPDDSNAHSTLGVLQLDLGLVAEAEQNFRVAVEKNPKDAIAADNLLFALSHNPDVSHDTIFAEHLKFAQHHEAPVRSQWPNHVNKRTPGRKLKIGLASGDLFRHAVASYLLPVLEQLAQDKSLSLHVYSNHILEDEFTHRLRACVDEWHQITGMPDAHLANRIRDDRIDILIDLSGHTGRNRLLTFARKPAPVQVSWIGYPATTGLSAMDYYFADRFSVPFGEAEAQFTEKIVHLPATAPFKPEEAAPPVNILPAMHNGYVTFGSFNRLNKLRRDVIALWAELLRAVPLSRMSLGAIANDEDERLLTGWFADEGIASERLIFRRRSSIPVYLQQHFQVDICLDTFPYTGSTTVLNSLWMGVPTLTMAGDTVPGRAATAWLSHAGLEAFVAKDKQDFVAKGVAFATDLDALASLRNSLRERCANSAAFRPDMVAAGVSRALRIMWQRWCDGQAPTSLDVSSDVAAHAEPSPSTETENTK
ncbi:tetratricopeptide repeat protein [Paraburkholderia xenovorans]|uniref:tetratricopeptide repeat protein n=1 Tax=Paraburkholderia xenovorans TaxID=36873 RepID=UPI0038BDEFD4